MGESEGYNRIGDPRRVLVTGGAGSLGRCVVDYLLKHTAATVCILDNDEESLYHLRETYKGAKHFLRLRLFYGSVTDHQRVKRAIEGVDTVIHLAALKHVWLGNENPDQVMKVNVQGTQDLIDATLDECNVESFLFVSSDKAVNPTNFYGQSKAMGEGLVLNANRVVGDRPTKFNVFRPGNFWGSSGSVIEKWIRQSQNGEAITVTSGGHKRFFIGLGEAAKLTYLASRCATGGNIFIPRMTEYRIEDLAGLIGKEITWQPPEAGEKHSEELFTEVEGKRIIDVSHFLMIPSET